MFRHSVLLSRGAISVSALAMAVAIASPAYAQSDASSLQGHVDGATSGTVTAVDTKNGQRASGTIDASGNYTIIGLRPSTYTVTAEGRTPVTVVVLVGQTAVADFAAAGAAASDIVITGTTRREVRTPSVSTNITPAQIESIPQNQRNFLAFAALAPGIIVAPGGVAQVQAGATSSSNVNVLLDGMSLKNSINHGGIFGQNFGLGNPFPQVAIQEYKVETQNFGAETGQVGSALITAVTKSGGNSFHGSAFIEWQPRAFIGQPYYEKLAGNPKGIYDRKQFGGDFGGPIIKDKLFFYISGEGTIQKLPGATGNIVGAPTNIAALINTPRNFDFKQGLYFGKLTFIADDKNTFNLSAFIRRENNLSDVDGNASASHGRTILTREDRYQFNWRFNSGNVFNQLNLSYDKQTQATPSVGVGPEFVISNAFNPGNNAQCPGGVAPNGANYSCGPDFSRFAQLGSHFFFQGDTQKSFVLKDDLTVRAGKHTLKAGLLVNMLDLSRTVNNTFNGSYFYYNTGPNTTLDTASAQPYGARINVQPSPTLKARDTQVGLYIQDEWHPDTHWTFNLGVRWDIETNALNNDYVTPPAIATALRNYQGWKAAGINPENYISTGNNRHIEWGAIQPRIGFSYDVKGDRDLVIFGGAGRYFDRSLFIAGVIESLTNSNRIPNVFFCNNGGPSQGTGNGSTAGNCVQFNNSFRDPANLRTLAGNLGSGGDVFVLNNKTPLPFSDQFDFGIRKRFGAIQASLTISHIRSHNIFQFVRANYYENGWYTRYVQRDGLGNVTGCTNGGNAWIQDNIPGGLTNGNGSAVSTAICPAQNGQLPGFSGKLDRGESNGSSSYTALYLTLEKPFTERTTWGFTTSLTIQRARTNVSQELNNDEVFNGTSQDVFGWNNVNGVPKWNFIFSGQYRAPFNILLAATVNLNSGPSFGAINFNNAPDGACCKGNFAGVYFPKPFIAYKRIDLRIGKSFKMPYNKGHELTVDFQAFNVFNWLNRTYSTWGAGSGIPAPLVDANSQVGRDARSFQAGLRYKF